MIQAGQFIKELSDQQSELGKLAKAESINNDVGAHDYNESLAGKDLDNAAYEPWWKEDNGNNKTYTTEYPDHHITDYDEPLSHIDGVFDESIPLGTKEQTEVPMNSSFEKVLDAKEANQKVDHVNVSEEKTNAWYCPKEGSGGTWEGERGNSKWIPDDDYTPQKHNPENKTWGEVKNEYGIDGVDFKEGEPNFSEVSKGEVTLDQKETDRGIVFNEADTKLAEQRGCEPWEVYKWRKENGYTWHETSDGLRAQKVPNIVHGNISHAGGHSNNLKTL